jgi:hypothetical protein
VQSVTTPAAAAGRAVKNVRIVAAMKAAAEEIVGFIADFGII